MKLVEGEFQLISTMVRDLVGVHLEDTKAYLVENRLGPIAKDIGCANFNDLYFRLRHGADEELKQRVIDAVTTHETLWFRDGAPYDALQFKVAPESIDARVAAGQPKKLRIWSAACSTGQEPYGIGMVLSELIHDIASWDVKIMATDVSKSTVEAAEKGVYAAHELGRTQRPQAMTKWFDKVDQGAQVKPEIRKLVTFRQFNLLTDHISDGPFDVVFLRNVLIYFDEAARKKIVDRIRSQMAPHGWLFLGSTESFQEADGVWNRETHCRAAVYRLKSRSLV